LLNWFNFYITGTVYLTCAPSATTPPLCFKILITRKGQGAYWQEARKQR